MSQLSDLDRLAKKEFHQCNLTAIHAASEYSEPEGGFMIVIAFEFTQVEGNKTYWRKTRVFSKRDDVREKALTALHDIDKSVNAGGVIRRMILEEAETRLFESGASVRNLLPDVLAIIGQLEPVRLTYGYSETMNHKTQTPYMSGYVLRIHPWLVDYNEVSPEEAGIMRDAANFCYTREWLEVRMKVLEVVGAVCMCCGATRQNAVITVDHIKPRSKYPSLALSPSNLQVLCRECNVGKGNSSEMDYRDGPQEHALALL
jgi:hypothetical protein